MNKLIILCKEDGLKPIKDLICENFPDKDIQVYTDIKDVPEDVHDMVAGDVHFKDEAGISKASNHIMRKLAEEHTEEQIAAIEDIVHQYQDGIKTDVKEDYKNYVQSEKECRKKDRKQQNKYALKYANKHYKK